MKCLTISELKQVSGGVILEFTGIVVPSISFLVGVYTGMNGYDNTFTPEHVMKRTLFWSAGDAIFSDAGRSSGIMIMGSIIALLIAFPNSVGHKVGGYFSSNSTAEIVV